MVHSTSTPVDSFQLSRDSWGRLQLIDREGRRHAHLRVKRMFPITDPDHWILLSDRQGRELACIARLDDLPPEPRRLLYEEISQTEFLPRIRKIHTIRRSGEALHFDAETDRGRTRFRLENGDGIRPLGDRGLLIIDEHGIRYLVRDVAALDAPSRRKLEWCLY